MSATLTPEIIRQAFEHIKSRMSAPPEPPRVLCHPLELPFFRVLFGEIKVSNPDIVVRWERECRRKYFMGAKTGDPRWTMKALIKQYEGKIEGIRTWRP